MNAFPPDVTPAPRPSLTVVPPLVERPLPVAWDDVPITWEPDTLEVGPVFACPPPKPSPCAGCGTLAEPVARWRGLVQHTEPGYWDRHPVTGRVRRHPERSWGVVRLVLARCGCGHDVVVDLDAGEAWDLDESDYGPAGSVHPDQVQGQLW